MRRRETMIRHRHPTLERIVRRLKPSAENFGAAAAVSGAELMLQLDLWSERIRAVIAGDTLIDLGNGLEIPASWLPEGVTVEQVASGLRPLLDKPVEFVLPTHGEPAERADLERALARSDVATNMACTEVVVQLRRRLLSRARGNRDKPHLCTAFTLKQLEHCRFAFPAHALNGFDPANPVLTSVGEPR